MLKFNDRNTKKKCEICSQITKAPKQHRLDIFIVNFGHVLQILFGFSIVYFEQVHVHWVGEHF